ncbi:MAG: hypothetical protein EBU70_09945, partial [Actinobacteria bacterium]|nr:hypothetical protein [Actinomycetota bacterium]
MRRVLAVAWREFRHTVLTKGFIFGALLMPVILLVVFAAVGALMNARMAPVSGTLAVIDPSGEVCAFVPEGLSPEAARAEIEEALERNSTILPAGAAQQAAMQAAATAPAVDIRVEQVTDAAQEEALRAKVQAGELVGLAIVPAELLAARPADAAGEPASLVLLVPTKSPPRVTELLEKAVADAVVRARVARAGSDYATLEALLSRPRPAVKRVSPEGAVADESRAAKMLLPMGFMML